MLFLRSILAMTLFCAFLCAGLVLLAGCVWILGAMGAKALVYPVFGLGFIALFPLSLVLAGRLAKGSEGGRQPD